MTLVASRVAARPAIVAAYTFVFCIALPGALWLAAAGLDRRYSWAGHSSPWGLPLLLLGLGLMGWSIGELWRRGRGLPVSALPPPLLARTGPYGHVRHPIYLGFNLAVLGAGLALGSPALAWVVAPACLPLWLAYARLEERGLERRFGAAYRRYRRQVGLFPRIGVAPVTRAVVALGALGVRYEGRSRVPRSGPCVLVGNHCCYLDPLYLVGLTPRPIRFLATAEAFRRGPVRWFLRGFGSIPLRRYRPDPAAYREVLRLLAEGEVVALAPEGERSPLGDYQGAQAPLAGVLARLGVPVLPLGLNGTYDCGPRWSGVLRRRPVLVRVGPPVRWQGREPKAALDDAIRALLDADPQPVHLAGLPSMRLGRVLWRCPRCADEASWRVERLACGSCGAWFLPTSDGRFEDEAGVVRSLVGLGRAVAAAAEAPILVAPATAWREASMFGAIRPLEPLGGGTLLASPGGLRLGEWRLPLDVVRSVTTERDDTLQVATREAMWQFRLDGGSVFRLQRALERWRRATSGGGATPPRRRRTAAAGGAPVAV